MYNVKAELQFSAKNLPFHDAANYFLLYEYVQNLHDRENMDILMDQRYCCSLSRTKRNMFNLLPPGTKMNFENYRYIKNRKKYKLSKVLPEEC